MLKHFADYHQLILIEVVRDVTTEECQIVEYCHAVEVAVRQGSNVERVFVVVGWVQIQCIESQVQVAQDQPV